MQKHVISLMLLSVLALTGCPKGGIPGVPGSAGASDVDPESCGNYAATDAGKKLKAFLKATMAINEAVIEAEAEMKVSCAAMAAELGVSEEGDTKTVCIAVSDSIKEHLSMGLKAGAKLEIEYEPAVCTINASAAASATASCEGKVAADVSVTCEGTCGGKCNGECEGASGEGGSCDGVCSGSCEGSCSGYADVEASLECEAHAEVTASVEAECTEPKLDISFEADMIIEQPKVDAVKAALMAGLPKLLQLTAKVEVPLVKAAATWGKSAKGLAGATAKLYNSLGDQASCVAGQLAGAAGMVADVKASLGIQVEVSASISASASAEGSAGS